MYNIDHFKTLIGAELEALVAEVNELKKRVTELENGELNKTFQDNKEFIGYWVKKLKKPGKGDFIG